jgi:CDP-4-dehydro-6-deoxyglucose reductase
VVGLRLERADGQPVAFRPGQWVSVAVPVGAGELWRAYSIASPESPAAAVELLVSRIPIGLASEALHEVAVGARLRMSDPGGTFRLADRARGNASRGDATGGVVPGGGAASANASRPANATAPPHVAAPAIFAATGTGIAPFRSMIRAFLAAPGGPVILVHGVRAAEDLLFRDEWEALAVAEARFRYRPTLSRGDDGWPGRRGYVGAHVEEALGECRAEAPPDVYLCGLRRMTDAVSRRLRDLGVPRERLHVEIFD